jgi:hypothetical protein
MAKAGRPKGSLNKAPSAFAEYVRRKTDEGEILIRFALSVLQAEANVEVPKLGKVTLQDRMDALKWLTDRGWGRAKELVQVEANEGLSELLMAALTKGQRG